MEETILNTEVIYDGRLVKLERSTVRLPNGAESFREVVRHPGAVAIVPVDSDGALVLVRQFRLPAGQVLLEIPAGTLENGEDPRECAIRELQEEIGYKPGVLEPLGAVYLAPGYSSEYTYLFIARDLVHSKLDADEDENLRVERVKLDDMLARIDANEIEDVKTVAAVLRAARTLGAG